MSVTYPIIINKSNYAGGSSFRYSFGTSVEMTHMSIALEKATVWFSWPNITAVKANNSFSIIHPTSSGTITLNLTIPDGGYNVSDLNNYLFWYLVSQGYYISNNSTGEQTVYCKFVVNPSTYQVQFISYPVPTALPSGFTAGPQLTFPSTSKGPQLSIASPAFGKVIGFATGTFPSSQPSTITTVSSTSTFVVSDVQNVVVTLDSCCNPYAPNSKVIHSFSPAGTTYANLITSMPTALSFIPQQSGWRSEITVQLCDQYLIPLNILDPDIAIILQLRIEKIQE
ncbi:hypothetical protein GN958_ATG22563 [Phytophthora infestans]|uniref:Uncharacterized protein n=1 Tax=Phytophthora infestans TaxID=4787 RepID=A0A8S9TJB5_PHYIN|nr:hypothetical protein GN958_ATG22563 [Phytophthora infestans]